MPAKFLLRNFLAPKNAPPCKEEIPLSPQPGQLNVKVPLCDAVGPRLLTNVPEVELLNVNSSVITPNVASWNTIALEFMLLVEEVNVPELPGNGLGSNVRKSPERLPGVPVNSVENVPEEGKVPMLLVIV